MLLVGKQDYHYQNAVHTKEHCLPLLSLFLLVNRIWDPLAQEEGVEALRHINFSYRTVVSPLLNSQF